MSEKERALDFMKRTAEAIAVTFGGTCETLVHDFTKPGHPIVAIYNGHVSGREIGSTADIFGSDLGEHEIDWEMFNSDDAVNTLAITSSGKYIKSTSVKYQGDDYYYVLGINFDYSYLTPALSIIRDLTTAGATLDEHVDNRKQTSLESVFASCVDKIGKPVANMKKQDKLQLIALLMEANAFDYQKAVSYIAEHLSTSRYTIYKYIHEIEENRSI